MVASVGGRQRSLGLIGLATIFAKWNKVKFCETSFAHNLLFSCEMVLKFRPQHDSVAVVLCVKFQYHFTIEMVFWVNEILRD